MEVQTLSMQSVPDPLSHKLWKYLCCPLPPGPTLQSTPRKGVWDSETPPKVWKIGSFLLKLQEMGAFLEGHQEEVNLKSWDGLSGNETEQK